MRRPGVEDAVVYVDAFSRRRNALVTFVPAPFEGQSETYMPWVNVVIVSNDAARSDTYGQQIERFTSVAHKSAFACPGNYWCWPEEYDAQYNADLRAAQMSR